MVISGAYPIAGTGAAATSAATPKSRQTLYYLRYAQYSDGPHLRIAGDGLPV